MYRRTWRQSYTDCFQVRTVPYLETLPSLFRLYRGWPACIAELFISGFTFFIQKLTFITIWANSVDDKIMMIFFLIFPRKWIFEFHANCLLRQFAWNIKVYFPEIIIIIIIIKKIIISIYVSIYLCRLLKCLHSMQSVHKAVQEVPQLESSARKAIVDIQDFPLKVGVKSASDQDLHCL